MRHIRQSLSLKLSIGYLLMGTAIFLAALGVVFILSSRIIWQKAKEHAEAELSTTVQRIRTYLNTIETALNANEWLVLDDLQPEALLNLSRRIVQMNRNVSGCSITAEPYLFPQYGRYISDRKSECGVAISAYSVVNGDTVITQREAPYDYYHKIWYKKPKEAGRACWVEPFDDFNEGALYNAQMFASYCKPVYRTEGGERQLIGVISCHLSWARLTETVRTEKPYPHAYYMLVGEQGHYFIHPDSMRLFSQTVSDDVLRSEMTAGGTGTMETDVDGVPCLVCYQPIPNTRWSLALVCPSSDIMNLYHRLMLLSLLTGAVGLLLIMLLCRQLVKRSIRPLGLLLEQSGEIAEGNYNRQIAVSHRADVVGALQNSFAAMQQSLRTHLTAIEQANAETEKRNKELVRATAMAQESDRQKTTFIQNMTHQVRTPLNIITGFAQVLRDSMGQMPAEEVKAVIDTMNHNAKHLCRMVLMLFDSSDTGIVEERSIRRDMKPVSCNEIARQCIDFTHEHFPTLRIHFETTLADDCCILTNELYMMRSVRELLYNSAKYSDGQHVCVYVSETEDCIRFVVEDTGSGIPPTYQPDMYVPFSKVNDLSEGLGLGLPLTKRHVDNLGGKLSLDRSYTAGCRFTIEMPK